MSLLVARDLAVSASVGGQTVPVLQGLNFSLPPGKILGLVGESGAGKSMLGRTVAQMLPAGFACSSGSLSFAGDELVTMPAAQRQALLGKDIAFIPQEPLSALNPVLTIGSRSANIWRGWVSPAHPSGKRKRSRCSTACICRTEKPCWSAIRTRFPAGCASAC